MEWDGNEKKRRQNAWFSGGKSPFLFLQKIFKSVPAVLLCEKCVILCIKHGLSAEKLTGSGDVRRKPAKPWEKIHNVLLAIMAKVGYNYEHEDGHPVLDKKS